MSWNHAYFVKHFTWRKFRFKNDFSSYNVNVKKASVGGVQMYILQKKM